MCTNVKEVNCITRSNERILSVFCPPKTVFLIHFIKNFHQNPWQHFSFLLNMLPTFMLRLFFLIWYYHTIISRYPVLLCLSVTLVKVIYCSNHCATTLHFLIKFKLLWSSYWYWYLVHHTCDLELSPANLPEKTGYQEWDSTLQPLFLSDAETTVFTLKVSTIQRNSLCS